MKKLWLTTALALVAFGSAHAQNAFLPNAGFETADGTPGDNVLASNWFTFAESGTFAAALDGSVSFGGSNSFRFDNQTSAGAFQGIVAFGGNGFVTNGSVGAIAEFMPTSAGTPITFSGKILESATAFSGTGKLQLEWADSSFNVFQRDFTSFTGAQINPSSWSTFSLTQAAPVGASYVKFVVVDDAIGGAGTGSFYVDSVAAIPEPSSIAMMAIGGFALMGLVVRRKK